MVQFCIPVDCRCSVPFYSLTNARIYIDAYLTLSASKVAIITSLDKPNEVILEDRKADPTLIIVAKIVSYIVLAPFALLALVVKWAFRTCSPLYLRPTALLTPPNQPVEMAEPVEGGLVRQGESSQIILRKEFATAQTDFFKKVELREKGYAQEVTQLMEQFQSLKQNLALLVEICDTEALKYNRQLVENWMQIVSDVQGKSEKFFSSVREWRQSCLKPGYKPISDFDNQKGLDKSIAFFENIEQVLKNAKELYQTQAQNEIDELQKKKNELQKECDELGIKKLKLELALQKK